MVDLDVNHIHVTGTVGRVVLVVEDLGSAVVAAVLLCDPTGYQQRMPIPVAEDPADRLAVDGRDRCPVRVQGEEALVEIVLGEGEAVPCVHGSLDHREFLAGERLEPLPLDLFAEVGTTHEDIRMRREDLCRSSFTRHSFPDFDEAERTDTFHQYRRFRGLTCLLTQIGTAGGRWCSHQQDEEHDQNAHQTPP